MNGWQSWRARIWQDTDPDRTGMLPFVFEDGMGFERYVDYALDVPMYFVYRDGRYIDALGQSFRDFLRGELPALPGEKPTLLRLGRPPDHDLPRGPDQAVHGDARRRRRPVAADLRAAGASGSGCSTTAPRSTPPGISAATGPRRSATSSATTPASYGLRAEIRGRPLGDARPRRARDRRRRASKARARPGAGGMIADETHFLNALHEIVAAGQTAGRRDARPLRRRLGRRPLPHLRRLQLLILCTISFRPRDLPSF